MDELSGQPSGAAWRRRERRLRSMLRHEQQTVRMALAAALHHSAGPKEKVEMQQNGALRGLKNAARAREVEEQVTHASPRAQKTPPPGARPGILAEPGPQRSDRSGRHFSGDTHPTLGLPVLAGESGEVIDDSTLAFLTRAVLEEKRKSEEEEKESKEEMLDVLCRFRADLPVSDAEWEAWQAWRGIGSSASGMKRKRKKRRKRKLPKSSSSRSTRGRARRRVRQWHAPGWFLGFDASLAGFPSSVGMPEFSRHLGRCGPEGQWRAHR